MVIYPIETTLARYIVSHGILFLFLRRASMIDSPMSCLIGTPGGPMNTPGGGGAGGPGLLGGVGRGRGGPVGRVGPTGLGVVGFGLVVVGHWSQYHRFLHRLLHSLMGLSLHLVVGTFWHDVLYVLYSHFRTRFQQLLLRGGLAKSKVTPAFCPTSAKGTSEGGSFGGSKMVSILFLSSQYGLLFRGLLFPLRFPLH